MTNNPLNFKKAYTNEELKDILSLAPTKLNLEMLAQKYSRSVNALKEIYRWANYTREKLEKKKRWNKFTQQIKRICAEIGLMKLP